MPSALADPERWGERTVEELSDMLEHAGRRLQAAIEDLAVDEAAYHRKFWSVWQGLDPSMSIAALNRECERQAADLQFQVILARSLVESHRVRRDGLVAVLGAKR